MKNTIVLVLLLMISNVYSQEEYFETSTMKGFPSLLKQVAKYETVKDAFTYFGLDEETYNAVFIKVWWLKTLRILALKGFMR